MKNFLMTIKNSIVDAPKNFKFLFSGITIFLAILLVIMAIPPCSSFFMYIAGEKAKLELIKFVGWGISGLIAIFGVIGLLQRAKALDEQNNMTEKGHIQERFNAAIEHLGNAQESVRIAAFYAFYRLAQIESEPDLRKHIFDILCAHLRQTTKDKSYKPEEKLLENKTTVFRSTEEVQSLLNILFKPSNKDNFIFKGLGANLEGANLKGANLHNAKLQNANLTYVNLANTRISKANLQKANMFGADLQKAILLETNLKEAEMWLANLRNARLCIKTTQGTTKNAILKDTILQGAQINLETTKMPSDWEKYVKKHKGTPGVKYVND